MKKTFIVCLVLLSSSAIAQDYMEKIAQESCKCIDKIPQNANTERYTQELGMCMLVASEPYKKQLKKDYNINFDNIDVEGEKLGRIIGLKMVSVCPNAILALTEKVKTTEETAPTVSSEEFEGELLKIETEPFVVFTVKSGEGKTAKFYWLEFADSNVELPDRYTSLNGKKVAITFTGKEFFDPKIGEYRAFNVIKKIAVINP